MAKVLVSLDDRLVERLDREAAARGISRSALLTELAAKGLGAPLGPGANPKVHRALEALDKLFANASYADDRDSTTIIREDRDNHW